MRALFLFLLFLPMGAWAGEVDENEIFHLSFGGKVYDDWIKMHPKEHVAKPWFPETHPSYPASGAQRGLVTWRCKECHGWDYKGDTGAYGAGSSHFTGIIGIRGMMWKDPKKVVEIIRDRTHRYDEQMIPREMAESLALFVTRGQVEMDTWIDRGSRQALGEPRRGSPFYKTICAICHGLDGRKLNFGGEEDPEFMGTVARENPWEAFHKIRNGHPDAQMVSMRALPLSWQSDILAFIQTLPATR